MEIHQSSFSIVISLNSDYSDFYWRLVGNDAWPRKREVARSSLGGSSISGLAWLLSKCVKMERAVFGTSGTEIPLVAKESKE